MRLNAASIVTGVAYFITNKESNTVLDLSAPNANSMSHISEIIYWFDALAKLQDGITLEEETNRCVKILL